MNLYSHSPLIDVCIIFIFNLLLYMIWSIKQLHRTRITNLLYLSNNQFQKCAAEIIFTLNRIIEISILELWSMNMIMYAHLKIKYSTSFNYNQGRQSNQCHCAMALVTFLVSKYQKSRKSCICLDFIIKKSRSGTG